MGDSFAHINDGGVLGQQAVPRGTPEPAVLDDRERSRRRPRTLVAKQSPAYPATERGRGQKRSPAPTPNGAAADDPSVANSITISVRSAEVKALVLLFACRERWSAQFDGSTMDPITAPAPRLPEPTAATRLRRPS
jgi:hypothetical protein